MMRSICFLFLVLAFCLGCSNVDDQAEPAEVISTFDGLAQSVFDSSVRVRSRGSIGSASAVGYLRLEGTDYIPEPDILRATHVEFGTNAHVAGKVNEGHVLDVWNHGDLVASVKVKTCERWFKSGVAKDLANFVVSLEELGGAQPVVPLTPYGELSVSPGDMVFASGCSDGRHPRARCGNVYKVSDGLIYYEPQSIPGDSGSGLFAWSDTRGQWETVGRTAWAVQEGGRWLGLAMTSDRIHDIKAGRVSTDYALPAGAVEIDQVGIAQLPVGAVRLDRFKSVAFQQEPAASPEPLEVSSRVHRWRFPIREGDIEPKRPRIRDFSLFGNLFEFLKNCFKYAKIAAIVGLLIFLYVAPTMMTPLSWDWGLKAIGLLIAKVLK